MRGIYAKGADKLTSDANPKECLQFPDMVSAFLVSLQTVVWNTMLLSAQSSQRFFCPVFTF